MQLKPILDLILLQSFDHSPEKLVFTTPILNSNTSDSITPEVDLFIPKIQFYSNFLTKPVLR
jgi:hypothetical protein